MHSGAIPDLHSRYGPWALIIGGAGGLSTAFATYLAVRGFRIVTDAPVDAGAAIAGAEILHTPGDALSHATSEMTAGLDIGLLVCVMEPPLAAAGMDNMRTIVLAHKYGQRMLDRGRGGVVITKSIFAQCDSPDWADTMMIDGLRADLGRGGVDIVFAHGCGQPSAVEHVQAALALLGADQQPVHTKHPAPRVPVQPSGFELTPFGHLTN